MTYASQKAGTSPATHQREADFGAVFTLSTACSVTTCVATVIDGPKPTNPTIPQPTRCTWNGSGEPPPTGCGTASLGDGNQKQWSKATSWAFYAPQADGTLRGTWHTDISDGPCRGSVVMPVAAAPDVAEGHNGRDATDPRRAGNRVRDHSMDFYRVAALVLVVLGHWVAASLTYRDGSFWRENPLVHLPWTQWLTWMFQVVPVFFVVAGYASAVSWSRHRHSGGAGQQAWLRHRLTRPLGPTAVYVVFALAVVAVLRGVGVAGPELDFGAWAVAMHLWFLGVYVVMIALTPVAMAAHRRWGLAVPAALAAAVAAVDLATIGAQLPYLGGSTTCCRGRCSTKSASPGTPACCGAARRCCWPAARRPCWCCWSPWGPTRSA